MRRKLLNLLDSVSAISLARLSHYWDGMSQPRPIYPGTTYLITRRIERRHCLLRPDPMMNAIILYTLIVAARRYGILIHAFGAMPTHVHYVVTDPQAQLPSFLAMFHRIVALGVKMIRKRDGAVWDRSQTSIVELCTREAMVEKIAYTLANPVKAGLVRYADEWPGVKTSASGIGLKTLQAKRPRHLFSTNNSEWTLDAAIALSLPPTIAATDAQAFRDDIQSELMKLEAAAHALIPKNKVLGVRRVLKMNPEQRITSHLPIRQLNPTFAVGRENCAALIRAKRAVRDFRQKYRRALELWRSGDRSVQFPAGTFAMRVFHRANIAPVHG